MSLMKWHLWTSCEHVHSLSTLIRMEGSCGDDFEWMGDACEIEVKFVATITSFSSTFFEISLMVLHLGYPFSSCFKNYALLNHKTSFNTALL